jgi:hypothetical protein
MLERDLEVVRSCALGVREEVRGGWSSLKGRTLDDAGGRSDEMREDGGLMVVAEEKERSRLWVFLRRVSSWFGRTAQLLLEAVRLKGAFASAAAAAAVVVVVGGDEMRVAARVAAVRAVGAVRAVARVRVVRREEAEDAEEESGMIIGWGWCLW